MSLLHLSYLDVNEFTFHRAGFMSASLNAFPSCLQFWKAKWLTASPFIWMTLKLHFTIFPQAGLLLLLFELFEKNPTLLSTYFQPRWSSLTPFSTDTRMGNHATLTRVAVEDVVLPRTIPQQLH